MQTSWCPGHGLSDIRCPVFLLHVTRFFFNFIAIKSENSDWLYRIDVVIPIGKTSLSIKKTRIRRESDRKIYPYRKHWKYPWRKCDCQGKCDIYRPCSKLKNWKSNFDLILTFRSLTRDLQRNTTSFDRNRLKSITRKVIVGRLTGDSRSKIGTPLVWPFCR